MARFRLSWKMEPGELGDELHMTCKAGKESRTTGKATSKGLGQESDQVLFGSRV